MDNHLLRPALGQVAPIGTLYDARRDAFLGQSLLDRQIPPGVASVQEKKVVDIQVSHSQSYVDKFKAINVGPDLAASILAGLVEPEGVGCHLVEEPQRRQILQAFIYHTTTVAEEKLDLMNSEIRNCISPTALRASAVTHVVTEIEYGAQSILTTNRWLKRDTSKERERTMFQQQVDTLVGAIRDNGLPMSSAADAEFDQISLRSTTVGNEEMILNDSEEARRFFDLLSLQIRSENGGKGKPIFYKLIPIQMLGFFNLVQIVLDIRPNPPSHECMRKFIQLCDEFRTIGGHLSEYKTFASQYKFCLPPSHLYDIAERVQRLETTEKELRSKFARTLQDVRGGVCDPDTLWQLVDDYSQGPRSPKSASTFTEDYRWKVAFIDSMLSQGATYIGYNSVDLRAQIAQRQNVDSYVFFFSESARQDAETWDVNEALMLSLLSNRKKNTFFAIMDCDATQFPLKSAIISHYDENGREVVRDLYDEQQYLAQHCFARYLPQTLETNVQRPTKRRLVKIPCPGGSCIAGNICEWRCLECHAPLEYGYSDQYIYCECGRSLYSNFDFKCNSNTHGPGFDRYNNTNLLNFLNSLDQSNYLNVLILGETGVGKSTFINAFVNYLYYDTLDEALNTEGLQWVIPCSFAIQTIDRSNSIDEIKETHIKVGERGSEHDGSKGDSATQQTQVYPITVRGVTYRLIDTPGIGDTRGLDHDKKNMADILATVSGYDYLHGILILLKSNNARLTAHFSFCVKELLTHLHRDATNNVVFGFTNTRISNYMPGDTFGSLKKLLSERADIGLHLSAQTSYCFDSESFRYLAAYKDGTVMENKTDFDRSWEKSRSEAVRMLDCFKTKEPHPIKSTLSLNGTRNLISELTKPMAEISQCIRDNIALMADDVRELLDARLTGDKLLQKLEPEIWLLRKKPTTMPRTVCSQQPCMEYKDDGSGRNMITEYPNPCHAVCYLENVPQDVLAHPDLLGCWAFSGGETCHQCNHHWALHLHILYEIESYKTTIKDSTVAEQIDKHASEVALKKAAIEDRKKLMEEWRKEHEQVQEAAAKFGLWMKANSILPYNDATLAYLDILIKAEKAKVDAGGINGGINNKKVLADLEEDRRKHEELVAVLTESMKDTRKGVQRIDQDEIQRIVQKLYNLEHFGKSLEQLKIDITEAHAGTNRELPHFVKIRHMSRSNSPFPFTSSTNGYRHAQSHSRGVSYPLTNRLSASGPNLLQKQQLVRSGSMGGRMLVGPNGSSTSTKMPGAFSSELPSQKSQVSYPMRNASTAKKTSFMSSLNPFSRS